MKYHRWIWFSTALLAASYSTTHAQYYYPYGNGYGGYGFGGWTSTVDGDIARGMGAFAAGAGVYNYDTAVADSINANTIAGINQYLYLSQQETNMREHMRLAKRQALVNATQAHAEQIATRIRDNPTETDITSGAALNAILDQLSSPAVLGGSNLRFANARIDSKVVRAIPFRDATDAITITLGQLSDEKQWPASMRDPKFDDVRQAYMKAMNDVLEEDKNGDLSPTTVRRVRVAISDLNRRVNETIPVTRQPDHLEAVNYLKGLAGFSRMLEKPNVDAILAELEKIKDTSAGNLVAFMHTYNLRFGAAETVGQREAYQTLYPIMVATRDKIVPRPEPGTTPAKPEIRQPSTAIFNRIDPQYLNPAPPSPGAPVNAPNTATPPSNNPPR